MAARPSHYQNERHQSESTFATTRRRGDAKARRRPNRIGCDSRQHRSCSDPNDQRTRQTRQPGQSVRNRTVTRLSYEVNHKSNWTSYADGEDCAENPHSRIDNSPMPCRSNRCMNPAHTDVPGGFEMPELNHSKAARRCRFRRWLWTSGLAWGWLATTVAAQQPLQLDSPNYRPTTDVVAGPGGPATAGFSGVAQLRSYSVSADHVGTLGAQLQAQYHDNPAVRITTDPKTAQLLVMAPEAIHRQVATQIDTWMRSQSDAPADVKQQAYVLRNLTWRELEDALQRLAGPRLTITTERNGEIANYQIANTTGLRDILQIDRTENRITFVGSTASIKGWSQVVFNLDAGKIDRLRATHVVPLAPAEPRRVQQPFQLIKATMQQGEAGGQTQAQVEVGDEETATAIGTIDTLGSESGLFGDVQIEFIEEIDLVIIKGSKSDVKRTLEVIEKIKEQARKTQPEVEVLQLKHANAEAVATLVTDLYANVYEPRQGTVSITALGQPNALLLIGRKETLASVKALIEKIDQPLAEGDQLKVIRLLHASSVDLETRIREFFVQNPPDGEQRVGLGTRVKVVADYRTNSLIVQAAPREMAEVEKLVAELDVEGAPAENEVRVFRLKNTLAEDLVSVIQEIIGGQINTGDTSQVTPPSGKLSMVTVDGQRVESGILAGVVISADPSVNALVVRAPSASMALIGKLIGELDQLPGAEATIKVFRLRNADATLVAQTLQGLFGLPVTAGQNATGNLLNNLTRTGLTTGGDSALVQLQIAAEARTNSVIVSGSESDLKVIEVLMLRLDEDVPEDRRSEVVWLRNANATEVATAVQNYAQQLVQAYQTLTTGTTGILSPAELVNRQIFVIPEATTNSLLVSAAPRYFEQVLGLIERLDRRPPLVSIQVLIAEVQLDDQFELGTEWGIQDGLLFDRASATGGTLSSPVFNVLGPLTGPSGGLGITQNVAGQALSNFGVGRTNAAGTGGLVLSASSEAVGILIRALQTANRLQVLSRPHITTLDSREASTLIGQQVPRVTGISQATLGTPQQIQTQDVPVGLGLAVLPRVNQDGLILMQVQIQNSSVGDPASGIPIGFGQNGEVIRSPIINTTEAITTVTAYSGQTVVFAGLISKNRGTARSQIPILGSLPIVGPAFRFDVETEQRRELLVVLTPRIIQTDEDYEMLKQVESSRMSWCLADVLNVHGDVGLSGGNGLWGPARSALIYPDAQPTVLEDRAVPSGHEALPAPGSPSNDYPAVPGGLDPDFMPRVAPPPPPTPAAPGDQATRTGATIPLQPVAFPTANNVPAAATPAPQTAGPASNAAYPGVQSGAYR
ncbi:MAG: general secretion pathway protein GspD [Planctomycetota bacterium]|nr:MAG: general secretion pathway protein GspD [Planctomycetota bacterium]